MDEDIQKRLEKMSKEINELSDSLIRLSLAYNDLKTNLEKNPTLFQH